MRKAICLIVCLLLPCTALCDVHVIMDERVHVHEEDGLVLAVFDARFPQLIGMAGTAVMDRVNGQIADFLRAEGGYDDVVQAATDAHAAGIFDFAAWTFSLRVLAEEKLHRENQLLAVLYNFAAYTGGAHEDNWLSSAHYSLETGDVVSLAELLTDADAFQAAAAEMLLAHIGMLGSAEALGYFDDYPETVRAWHLDQALLTSDGLLVYFNPYEVAPFSAGPQLITLDYALVSPYFTDLCRAWLGL